MSESILLSDFFERQNINAKDTLLIRHPWAHVKKHLKTGLTIKDFTEEQSLTFKKKEKLWLIFIGEEKGTSARFYTAYINHGFRVDGSVNRYQLEETNALFDLKDRLVIDWGSGALSWAQSALNPKPIIAIQAKQLEQFSGYQNVKSLSFDKVKSIVEDKERYAQWHTALSSIKAIYLIVNHKNGKMYVGSAYGKGGLLSRWACYINTKTGGNVGIIEDLEASPEDYKHFHFSILQVISPIETEHEIITLENTYKDMLLSIEFGMNKN